AKAPLTFLACRTSRSPTLRRGPTWASQLSSISRRSGGRCRMRQSEHPLASPGARRAVWAFVADAPAQAADLAVRMVPPDWGFIHALWRPMWDTINMATLGTVMGIMLALPVAYCAARNTTPSFRAEARSPSLHPAAKVARGIFHQHHDGDDDQQNRCC